MKLFNKPELAFLALVFFYSFVPTFGGLLRVGELLGGPAIITENPRAIANPLPILLHIFSSFCFCMFGALQFLPTIRRVRVAWHRAIGTVVAIAGLVSALTGLWMTLVFTFPEQLQGPILFWARIVISVSMLILITRAVLSVHKGDVPSHGSAMLRAYAIGQGASTQAFLGIGWVLIAGSEPAGPGRDLLMVGAWVLNLLIAEYLIARTYVRKHTAKFDRVT